MGFRGLQCIRIAVYFIDLERAILIRQQLRMHKRQVKELPQLLLRYLVETMRKSAIGDGPCQRVVSKGTGATPKHVAWELIEKD